MTIDNDYIAEKFSLLSKLMDIHGENSFKTKSYSVAAFTLEKLPSPIAELPSEKMTSIRGIGDAIGKKIAEILETGELRLLQQYISQTPPGVIQMLNIKGLGPKKIATIWKEMEIESIGELLYACQENRLLLYKGFGEKTQQNVGAAIEFFLQNQGSHLYAEIEPYASRIDTNYNNNSVQNNPLLPVISAVNSKSSITSNGSPRSLPPTQRLFSRPPVSKKYNPIHRQPLPQPHPQQAAAVSNPPKASSSNSFIPIPTPSSPPYSKPVAAVNSSKPLTKPLTGTLTIPIPPKKPCSPPPTYPLSQPIDANNASSWIGPPNTRSPRTSKRQISARSFIVIVSTAMAPTPSRKWPPPASKKATNTSSSAIIARAPAMPMASKKTVSENNTPKSTNSTTASLPSLSSKVSRAIS